MPRFLSPSLTDPLSLLKAVLDMKDKLRFLISRMKEQLWIKPLVMCGVSILAVLLAKVPDLFDIGSALPEISRDSIETLLKIISASMLVMAIFAVGSMVTAYASASGSATPRAFPLVIADDVSQNALSAFVGAFIFSLVGMFALMNDFYGPAGLFALLSLTGLVFAMVIVTFLGWVDRIARLGRLGGTLEKVEAATASAMKRRRVAPRLGGVDVDALDGATRWEVYADSIGYIQQVNAADLQVIAEDLDVRIEVAALPGTFATPNRPLAYISAGSESPPDAKQRIASAFIIGPDRTFEDDPRFGLVVMSEIAGRALSPGINDPGTAISVIGKLVRLFILWDRPIDHDEPTAPELDRVAIPQLSTGDMFDDAFTAIGRDGAGTVEVMLRLQKALDVLSNCGSHDVRRAARHHAQLAMARAEKALGLPQDLDAVRQASERATRPEGLAANASSDQPASSTLATGSTAGGTP